MTRSSGFIFLLTRLLRGATCKHSACLLDDPISTHTPLARRDAAKSVENADKLNFYSHAPCGARQNAVGRLSDSLQFLLTRPMRGATSSRSSHTLRSSFLLTRPMRGATFNSSSVSNGFIYFYSHAPCGARRCCRASPCMNPYFYSHAPCGARLCNDSTSFSFL